MEKETQKPTSDAVEIMHRRYIKGKKRRLKYIERERERVKIAQKIHELRTQAGLTQKQLADIIGTRQSVISRLENADYRGHKIQTLEKIAEALNYHLKLDFEPIRKMALA
jgi:ribosome-binding protein aMBF1 (putative translation factor)